MCKELNLNMIKIGSAKYTFDEHLKVWLDMEEGKMFSEGEDDGQQ